MARTLLVMMIRYQKHENKHTARQQIKGKSSMTPSPSTLEFLKRQVQETSLRDKFLLANNCMFVQNLFKGTTFCPSDLSHQFKPVCFEGTKFIKKYLSSRLNSSCKKSLQQNFKLILYHVNTIRVLSP
jgi:DNA helicase TIP49 (TBP-interacting protein)